MNTRDKYIAKWKDVMISAASALSDDNFDLYNKLMDDANNIVEKMKRDNSLTYECTNFGMANYIFEEALPTMFKKNKKAVNEFINTIKEDKNLLNQFKFFYALNNYKKTLDAKEYLNESLELLQSNIDSKTLNESNKKLSEIISRREIKPSEPLSEDKMKYFSSCDYLFKNGKKLTNLAAINEARNSVMKYMVEHAKNDEQKDSDYVAEAVLFVEKNSDKLTEEDKKILKDFLDLADGDIKKAFYSLKEECLNILENEINKTENADEKSDFETFKECISNKEFNKETLAEDIEKMIETKKILIA